MATYFNNLQEEVFLPSAATSHSSSSRHRDHRGSMSRSNGRSRNRQRQRPVQEQDDDEYYDSYAYTEDETHISFRDEPDSRDATTRPLCSSTTNSSSTARGRSQNSSSNNSKKIKKQPAKTDTPAVISVAGATTASSVASSKYGTATSVGRQSRSSSTRTPKPGLDKTSDIYEAYRRLRRLSLADKQQAKLLEEEHGSASTNNTPSQQTPATSSSTQMSTEEDEEQSHQLVLRNNLSNSSSNLSSPKQQQRQQQQQQQQDPPYQRQISRASDSSASAKKIKPKRVVSAATTATAKVSNRGPTNMRIDTTLLQPLQEDQPQRQQKQQQSPPPKPKRSSAKNVKGTMIITTTNNSKQQPQQNPVIGNGNAKRIRGNTEPLTIPSLEPLHRQEQYHVHIEQPQQHQTDPLCISIPIPHHPPIRQTDDSMNSHNIKGNTASDYNRERAPSSIGGDSSVSSEESSHADQVTSLHITLANGEKVNTKYSSRIENVKANLRRSMRIPPQQTPKSKQGMADNSQTTASSIGGSGSRRHTGILRMLRRPPKPERSESERRRRQNPFLNRPTGPIQKSTTIGLYSKEGKGEDTMDGAIRYNHQSSMDTDHQRRPDAGDDDKASYNGEDEVELTFQQKYFPLPKPIQKIHEICGQIVTNSAFQIFMVFLIMLNALILGIATYDFTNPKIPLALDYMDKILLYIFTIELGLQFGYCGYTLLLDGWLVFDTLTIVTSWWLEGVQVFRSFRIFRSFRLVVRLPLLKNLALTLFHVIPRINSILCLTSLILYIYGVLCTILYSDMYELGQLDKQYFGRLDYSIFTLFQILTLEGWGEIVRQVSDVYPVTSSLIFSSFVILTGFIMYNLIVAVLCDSMLVVEAQARAEIKAAKREKRRLEELVKKEEQRKAHKEMILQKREEHAARILAQGLIKDDSTDPNHLDFLLDDLDEIDTDEEESVVSYREHVCDNCGFCEEIPKIPTELRRRIRERDAIMVINQDRVRSLKDKVEQMARTQQRVTAVLQTLMMEIEANRNNNSKNTSISSAASFALNQTATSTSSNRTSPAASYSNRNAPDNSTSYPVGDEDSSANYLGR